MHGRGAKDTMKTIGIILLTILVTEMLRYVNIGEHSLLPLYMLSVFWISCSTNTYIYGLVAALVNSFAYDFFIYPPRLGFSFHTGFPITLLTMLAVTTLTSTLLMKMKKQAEIASKRQQYAQLMYEINQKLLVARDMGAILRVSGDCLARHFQQPVVFYREDPVKSAQPPRVFWAGELPDGYFDEPAEREKVHALFAGGKRFAWQEPLRGETICYMALCSAQGMLGVLGMRYPQEGMGQDDVQLLHMMVGQMTLAMEVQQMSDQRNLTLLDSEREKAQSILLRSVSHDLRTPLTSILGASSAIAESEELTGRGLHLVEDIRQTTQWVIRMVENILTVTRLSYDGERIKKVPEAAEEVIAQAISIIRRRYTGCHIQAKIPQTLIMVPMDGTLICQVLINLLENALRYTSGNGLVQVGVTEVDDGIRFDVMDHGRGIPEYMLDKLFEPGVAHSAEVVDASHGVGIGLSICKAIVQAHGGTIRGQNKEEGGAIFSFTLPLGEG